MKKYLWNYTDVFGTHLPYELTEQQVSFVTGCDVC
jgi:hypothetical protein